MGISSFNISTFFFLCSTILFCFSQAKTPFEIRNQCSYPVWAAALPGGGKKLNPDETWVVKIPNRTTGWIWGRTNCTFSSTGKGSCRTGDCNNQLKCKEQGASPSTLVEYSLNTYGKYVDHYYLSLVNGFNIPMEVSPITSSCRSMKCDADINGQCPVELRIAGGCQDPCTAFQHDPYCCNSGNCTATDLSNFFKTMCPDAFSFAYDDPTTFTCPTGSKYRVVFCPSVPPPPSFAHMCVRIII